MSKLLVFSGPCQIESLDHCLYIADKLQSGLSNLNVKLVFKASFDKANRTSIDSQRGVGLEKGLEILSKVKEQTGLPVLTDVHSAKQITECAEVIDILQIPAFLCRQTDLLVCAGSTGKVVNIKKGQFLAPADMKFVAEKVLSAGNADTSVLLCERGTCFGYRDLVVDFRSLKIMQDTGFPVIFDATHSVQAMGGSGNGESGGSREFILPLIRAAIAFGCNGLFAECHNNPKEAPSDGATMLLPEELIKAVKVAVKIKDTLESEDLDNLSNSSTVANRLKKVYKTLEIVS